MYLDTEEGKSLYTDIIARWSIQLNQTVCSNSPQLTVALSCNIKLKK